MTGFKPQCGQILLSSLTKECRLQPDITLSFSSPLTFQCVTFMRIYWKKKKKTHMDVFSGRFGF